jgi:glycine betaine/proline transport system permease protein
MDALKDIEIPIGDAVEAVVDWIQDNFEPLLDGIAAGVGFVTDGLDGALLAVPPILFILGVAGLGMIRVGWQFAVFATVALLLVLGMGLWDATVSTMALVIASSLFALLVGFPIGVAMAKNDVVEAVVRPILDLMQTMPPFVYLIPAAMFFGLGKVPGAIATVIFAMPPAVRLTNLGIRQVTAEHVEAGLAFGCTPRQLLFKVQLPLAKPSIMAGVNQTIMLALSMVVIASMIGAGGLGNTVLTGIQRLNIGLGFEGGLGVVILAIILDRITQSFGATGHRKPSLLGRVMQAVRGKAPSSETAPVPASKSAAS